MTTDQRLDDTITSWLEGTAASRLPERVLDATFERTRNVDQHVGWRVRLGGPGVPRSLAALGSAAVVLAVTVIGLGVYLGRSEVHPTAALPSAPADWTRVVIDGDAEGGVDVLAAGSHGVLAGIGEGSESRLYFSADGSSWTRVPADQHPPVGTNGAAMVASDRGFLLVGREVVASADGLTWQHVGGADEDQDLLEGTPIAAAAAGPGYVAVGSDNKAWYSADGTDWTQAEVPPAPGAPSGVEGGLDPDAQQGVVEMQGVAESGRDLIAWGTSVWVNLDGSATFVPVLWTSSDGMAWANVPPPDWAYPKVAGGPDGFAVASEDGAVWLSGDGRSWERASGDAFGSSRWPVGLDGRPTNADGIEVSMHMNGIAAGPAGYVAAGTDGECLLACRSEEAVIWTSRDGGSWTRLSSDARFSGTPASERGAKLSVAARWGSRFIVGGIDQGAPAIWISDEDRTSGVGEAPDTTAAVVVPTVEPEATGTPVDPATVFLGTWAATDTPGDDSHLTMRVVASPDGTYDVTILDDVASVCDGASSTMTSAAHASATGELVLPQPEYTCDDGSEAQAMSGPPLKEQLRNLTFRHEAPGDALVDSLGLVWDRAEAAP